MTVVESMEKLTFSDVTKDIYEHLQSSYHQAFAENLPPNKLDSWNITTYGITCVLVMTAVLSSLRFILSKLVFMPIADYYDIPKESRARVSESAWRFTFQICAWIYKWYVVILSGKYKFFQEPETMWHGWSLDTVPPGDIYLIYVIDTAYYLQFTYSTIFSDTRRKDYVVMVFHHVLSLTSIFTSNATRCHNLGVLILFLLHMSVFFLEFSKLCSYFKIQGLKVQKRIEIIRYIEFACFLAVWFISRIYWYPLKVIHAQAVYPRKLKLDIPYMFFMQLQALGYFALRIYWTSLILKIVYNLATGQKAEDPRESIDPGKDSGQLSFYDKRSNSILKGKHL